MEHVTTLVDTVEEAFRVCHTFDDDPPELVPTGIKALDNTVGGLGKGSAMIIGADTGVGKSTVCLLSMLNNMESGVRTGYVSCEDTADVVGCRILSHYSKVNSRNIRRKELTKQDTTALEEARSQVRALSESEFSPVISYQIGRPLTAVLDAVAALGDQGCELVIVDYLQKIKGGHTERNIEVSRAFTSLQGAVADIGAALIAVSQVRRVLEPGKVPRRHHLKESGDLENEARVILMLGKDLDGGTLGVLDKSTYGGEGLKVNWERTSWGGLKELPQGYIPEEEF